MTDSATQLSDDPLRPPSFECITKDPYKNIDITHGTYANNYIHENCIRIDYDASSSVVEDPNNDLFQRTNGDGQRSLRLEFKLNEIALEQGFDNLILNWQYNQIYHPYYAVWTDHHKDVEHAGEDITEPPLWWNVLPGLFVLFAFIRVLVLFWMCTQLSNKPVRFLNIPLSDL